MTTHQSHPPQLLQDPPSIYPRISKEGSVSIHDGEPKKRLELPSRILAENRAPRPVTCHRAGFLEPYPLGADRSPLGESFRAPAFRLSFVRAGRDTAKGARLAATSRHSGTLGLADLLGWQLCRLEGSSVYYGYAHRLEPADGSLLRKTLFDVQAQQSRRNPRFGRQRLNHKSAHNEVVLPMTHPRIE